MKNFPPKIRNDRVPVREMTTFNDVSESEKFSFRNMKRRKMFTSRTGIRPFLISGGKFFMCRIVVKNGHFANGKAAVSPEARIRFPRLRNVQKWSHRDWDPGVSHFGRKTFNVPKRRKMAISRTVSRPFCRRLEYAFSGSERPEMITSRTGTRPFRISGGKFLMCRNVGKRSFQEQ